jgi:AP-3 complex subunit beta
MSNFNVNLESITENASRLGARIQETFSERTRDLAARGSNALFLDAPEDKLREVRKQLDAGSDREKVDAMKRLIAVSIIPASSHTSTDGLFS